MNYSSSLCPKTLVYLQKTLSSFMVSNLSHFEKKDFQASIKSEFQSLFCKELEILFKDCRY